MRKSTYYLKFVMLFAAALFTLANAKAQDVEKTKYVCDINANSTLDLGFDVMGEVLTREGGRWDQIESNAIPAVVKFSNVSNIFNMVGKGPGTYTFRYTATNNACLPVGHTRTAVVTILETPKTVSHDIYLCDGESKSIDLSTVVSATLPGVTFSNPSAGSLSGSDLTIPGSATGQITIDYSINHGFMNTCNDAAVIVLNLDRTGTPPQLTISEITYCEETIPASINLTNASGTTVTSTTVNGIWTAPSGSAVTVTNGVADFSSPVAGDYVFTYTWPASTCYSGSSATFTVKVLDNLSWPTADPTDNICKSDNPNRIYNLMQEGFGLNLPASAGVWTEVGRPAGAAPVTITDGLFEVADAKPGPYKYQFTISSAAEGICYLDGSNTITLNVGDIDGSMLDGRMQICQNDLESASGNLALYHFVPGMDASGATWSAPTPPSGSITITNGVLSYADLALLGSGTHKFTFNYGSAGCSGTGEGSLYVTVADGLDVPTAIELEYCRPDVPGKIYLNQVVGADLTGKGTWDISGSGNNNSDLTAGTDYTSSGELVLPTTGTGEYEFTFSSTDTTGDCAVQNIVVTVKVVDNF